MKYVSIDIETTSLDPTCNVILEVGLVFEDMLAKRPIEELPKYRILLPREQYTVTPFIMKLHRELFEELDGLKLDGAPWKQSGSLYTCYPNTLGDVINKIVYIDERFYQPGDSIIAAGKNVGAFDIPFIKRLAPGIKFKHRTLDPMMLYLRPEDEVPPDLKTCAGRAGIELTKHHSAVGDALDVVRLIRRYYEAR